MLNTVEYTRTVILTDLIDWKPWLLVIRITIKSGYIKIWKYINPANDISMPVSVIFEELLLNIYEDPVSSENLFLRTYVFNEYKLKLYSYEKECKVVKDIQDVLDRIRLFIVRTVILKNYNYIKDQVTELDILRSLQSVLSNISETKKRSVKLRYRKV